MINDEIQKASYFQLTAHFLQHRRSYQILPDYKDRMTEKENQVTNIKLAQMADGRTNGTRPALNEEEILHIVKFACVFL